MNCCSIQCFVHRILSLLKLLACGHEQASCYRTEHPNQTEQLRLFHVSEYSKLHVSFCVSAHQAREVQNNCGGILDVTTEIEQYNLEDHSTTRTPSSVKRKVVVRIAREYCIAAGS